jgi:Flp pilus assembly protein TadG
LLLPITTIAVDFCRVFFAYTTITNAADTGALWLSDPLAPSQSPFPTFQDAVMADANNLNPALTSSNIMSSTGTDGRGNATVSVTVQYQFNLVTSFLGLSSVNLSRQVTMRKQQITPD